MTASNPSDEALNKLLERFSSGEGFDEDAADIEQYDSSSDAPEDTGASSLSDIREQLEEEAREEEDAIRVDVSSDEQDDAEAFAKLMFGGSSNDSKTPDTSNDPADLMSNHFGLDNNDHEPQAEAADVKSDDQPLTRAEIRERERAAERAAVSPDANIGDSISDTAELEHIVGSYNASLDVHEALHGAELAQDDEPENDGSNMNIDPALAAIADNAQILYTPDSMRGAVENIKNEYSSTSIDEQETIATLDFDKELDSMIAYYIEDPERRAIAKTLIPTPDDISEMLENAEIDQDRYMGEEPDSTMMLFISQARVSSAISRSAVEQQLNDSESSDAISHTLLEFANEYILKNIDELLAPYDHVLGSANNLQRILDDQARAIREEYMQNFAAWLDERLAELKEQYIKKNPPLRNSQVNRLRGYIRENSQRSLIQANSELLNTREQFARHLIAKSRKPVFAAARRHLTTIDQLDASLAAAAAALKNSGGKAVISMDESGVAHIEPISEDPQSEKVQEPIPAPAPEHPVAAENDKQYAPEPDQQPKQEDAQDQQAELDDLLGVVTSKTDTPAVQDNATAAFAAPAPQDEQQTPEDDDFEDDYGPGGLLGSIAREQGESEPQPQDDGSVKRKSVLGAYQNDIDGIDHKSRVSTEYEQNFDNIINPQQDDYDDQTDEIDAYEEDHGKKRSGLAVAVVSSIGVIMLAITAFLITGYVYPGFMKDDVVDAQANPGSGQVSDELREELKQISGKYRIGDGFELVTSNGIINVEIVGFNVDGAVAEDPSGDRWLITNDQLKTWMESNADEFAQREAVDNLGDDPKETEDDVKNDEALEITGHVGDA